MSAARRGRHVAADRSGLWPRSASSSASAGPPAPMPEPEPEPMTAASTGRRARSESAHGAPAAAPSHLDVERGTDVERDTMSLAMITPDDEEPDESAPAASGGGSSSLLRSSTVMAAGTAASRVLGMLRITVLAWALGARNPVADSFTASNTLPNIFFNLIGGGVFNAVLVPQIVAASRSRDGGKEFLDRLLTLGVTLLGGTTIVLLLVAQPLTSLYRAPATPYEATLEWTLALWCLPQVLFYGLYTLWGQVLNARNVFGPFMWAPLANNVVSIVGMVAFVLYYGAHRTDPTWWTPWRTGVFGLVTTGGVAAQALVLWPVLRRAGVRWRPRWGLRGVGLGSAGAMSMWSLATALIGQLQYVLISQTTTFAEKHGGAGLTMYSNSYLLFMLPHSLVAVSLTTAAFTRMSEAANAGDRATVRETLVSTVRLTGLATVASIFGFLAIGHDAVRLVLAGNSDADVTALYYVTCAQMLGLVAFSAQYVTSRVFFAFREGRAAFYNAAAISAAGAVGTLLARTLAAPAWMTAGVALGAAGASLVGLAISWRRVGRYTDGLPVGQVVAAHGRYVVAAVPAALAAWLLARLGHLIGGAEHLGALLAIVLGGAAFLGVYVVLLRALRVPEVRQLSALVGRRRGA